MDKVQEKPLPNGWRRVKLGEVCSLVGDTINPQAQPQKTFAHFSIPAYDDGRKPTIEQGGSILSNKVAFPKGAVLFSKLNPRISRVWHVDFAEDYPMICSTEFLPLLPSADLLASEYLEKVLQEPSLIWKLRAQVAAATKSRERLSPELVLNCFIPLPPLPEQRRIAGILKEQMAAVEKARAAAEAQLQAAQALPVAYLREVFPTPDAPLPKGWRWVKLGEVCETGSGGTPSRGTSSFYGGSIPWVKSGELNDGVVCGTEESITELGLSNSSAKLVPKGTLLIAMYGATVGKLGILGIDAATNQAVCAIFPQDSVCRDYLFHFLFQQRKTLVERSFGGAQPNISQEVIRAVTVPLPSLDIQHLIATDLNAKSTKVEKLKAALSNSLNEINALPSALLRQAFSGEL